MNTNELHKLREQLTNIEVLTKEVTRMYMQHLMSLKDMKTKAQTGEFPTYAKYLESLNPDINVNFRLSAFHSMIIEIMEKNNRQILDYVDGIYENNHQ